MEKGIVLIMLEFLENVNPKEYSSLVLAYIGDAVFELYARNYVISKGNTHIDDIHKTTVKYVNAAAQSEFYRKIESILTEEEEAAFKRGRNAKSKPPKNADVVKYKIATGFEALIGYIYLKGDKERLNEIMNIIFG